MNKILLDKRNLVWISGLNALSEAHLRPDPVSAGRFGHKQSLPENPKKKKDTNNQN
jgi:hypothetical protein